MSDTISNPQTTPIHKSRGEERGEYLYDSLSLIDSEESLYRYLLNTERFLKSSPPALINPLPRYIKKELMVIARGILSDINEDEISYLYLLDRAKEANGKATSSDYMIGIGVLLLVGVFLMIISKVM